MAFAARPIRLGTALFLCAVLGAMIAVVHGGDGTQREGRGIGLSEEERASAKEALAKEEAARLSLTQEQKEAMAKSELNKMMRKTKKAANPRKKVPGAGAGGSAKTTRKAIRPAGEDLAEELVGRSIGISDEERKEFARELEEEERRRFATDEEEKKKQAQIEMAKLNKKSNAAKRKNKAASKKKKANTKKKVARKKKVAPKHKEL